MLLAHPARLLPTVADLVARAVADGDFYGDIAPDSDLLTVAAEYTDRGIDTWADDNDVLANTVPVYLWLAARAVLSNLASALLRHTETAEADARADAIEAGDMDHDGNPIPYDTCRSARA
jgi:hypothetical protein